MIDQQPSDPTIRDVFAAIRRHWFLLVATVTIAVAAAVAYSLARTPTYAAEAFVAFRDQTTDVALAGVPIPTNQPIQTPQQLAAANVRTVTGSDAAAVAKAVLKSSRSPGDLAESVSAAVQPNSGLVEIKGTASSPRRAQATANAFATATAVVTNRRAREGFAAQAAALKREAAHRSRAQRTATRGPLTRLRGLSAIARPAQVVTPAKRPAAQMSPRMLRNVLFAAILGGILGLLGVFVRDSLDGRVRRGGDIESELDVPLLGHVRDDVLGRSARPDDGRVPTRDWELFRILERNLEFAATSPQNGAIAVTSAIQGDGKTTVASFLAFASAAIGRSTLLLECDLRGPALAERLGIQSGPGVTDVVNGEEKLDTVVQAIAFGDLGYADDPGRTGAMNGDPPHHHELCCVTAGSVAADPAAVLRSEGFRSMLREARRRYDRVILDTTPLLSVVDVLEVVTEVDALVFCLRAAHTTRDQVRAARAALDRLPARPTALVVTGTSGRDEAVYGYQGDYAPQRGAGNSRRKRLRSVSPS